MAIQKTNTSFGVTLRGDSIELIRASVKGGLDNKGVKRALQIIQNVCPKPSDKVYLYYRNMQRQGYDTCEFAGIRAGVKVAKDGVVLEKNIDVRGINPKYLLHKFALTVKKLVTGDTRSDETIKLFK